MILYPSAYRAGNFADIHKHSIFCLLVKHLTTQSDPLLVMDTHAGAGLFSLSDDKKNTPPVHTINHLLQEQNIDTPLNDFCDTVCLIQEKYKIQKTTEGKTNAAKTSVYPGAPRLALTLMRDQDQLICSESSTREANLLSRHIGPDKRATTYQRSGLGSFSQYKPPEKTSYLSFINPVYQNKNDYTESAQAILDAYKQAPTMTALIWYPLLKEGHDKQLKALLLKAGIKHTLMSEIAFYAPPNTGELYGSGLIILNAPRGCETPITSIGNDLARVLSPDASGKAQCYLLNV